MQLNHAMMNDQIKNDRDRELFSELIEPPIHPHLIQVVPPFPNTEHHLKCMVSTTGCLTSSFISLYGQRTSLGC